jgi:serine/threonine protein kinase
MAKAPKDFETLSDTYSVTSVIGEGGSGRVFAVKDSTGVTYALKCLFPHLSTTQKRKRFKNEVDFCSKQVHPNLIQIKDSGLVLWDNAKAPFYVMPLLPATLRKLLEQKIPPAGALHLFAQILNGVEAAHLLGVVHRDLKPENILYDSEQDLLVIADFGIAHFQEELLATAVATKAGERLANLCYSAPEQRVKGASVDRRADIYALGLILNEMFTGAVPQGAGYRTIGAVVPEYTYLDALVDRMIQQAPDARPANLEEVKKELIGRKNEFVALQQLDAKRRKVVPANAPGRVVPVRLVGVDWDGGTLTLQLDRVPEPGWVQRFQQPRQNYSFVGGADPPAFQFRGNIATVRAHENLAQEIINTFKQFLDMATRGYQEDLDAYAANNAREQRRNLELEVAEAEKRARILKSLKV